METMLAILLGVSLLNLIYLVGIEIEIKQIEEEIKKIKQFLKGFRDGEEEYNLDGSVIKGNHSHDIIGKWEE